MHGATSSVVYTRTFQDLREWALKTAGVSDHFEFVRRSTDYRDFWDDMNRVEFNRGYDPVEYLKPDSSPLCEMKLITEEEFEIWQKSFESLDR